jgi:predicted PhzF superfamily epimerase YddE/YHI9
MKRDRPTFEEARLTAEPPFDAGFRAQDHWTVNLGEDWEVRFWAREFGVSEDELREAVRMAGANAGRVKAWLHDRNHPRPL